jgi:hypothetical protein
MNPAADATAVPSSVRINDNLKRECPNCRYAVFPNSSLCTNRECSNSRHSSGAITSHQLLRDYTPPRLFHGRRWNNWTLDAERLCLVYDAWPEERGNGSGRTVGVAPYVGYFGAYEVDLETIRDSAAMLDWIFQVSKKSWADARVTKDLLNALDSIFHAQANLCSGHAHKTIKDAKAFLRSRFDAVGVTA